MLANSLHDCLWLGTHSERHPYVKGVVEMVFVTMKGIKEALEKSVVDAGGRKEEAFKELADKKAASDTAAAAKGASAEAVRAAKATLASNRSHVKSCQVELHQAETKLKELNAMTVVHKKTELEKFVSEILTPMKQAEYEKLMAEREKYVSELKKICKLIQLDDSMTATVKNIFTTEDDKFTSFDVVALKYFEDELFKSSKELDAKIAADAEAIKATSEAVEVAKNNLEAAMKAVTDAVEAQKIARASLKEALGAKKAAQKETTKSIATNKKAESALEAAKGALDEFLAGPLLAFQEMGGKV